MDQLDLWGAPKQALPLRDLAGLTVETARMQLEEALLGGSTCPCCDRFTKRYRRGLTAGMAVVLCRIVRHGRRGGWVNVPELPNAPRGGDYAKLLHWGLLEQAKPDPDDPTRRSSGLWRATARGVDFVLGRVSVPRAYIEYNNRVLGFEAEPITIREALGKRFDYSELMAEVSHG